MPALFGGDWDKDNPGGGAGRLHGPAITPVIDPVGTRGWQGLSDRRVAGPWRWRGYCWGLGQLSFEDPAACSTGTPCGDPTPGPRR